MKKKLLWRFRKRSEADPIKVLPCGCRVWIYDGTIVRRCEKHISQNIEASKCCKAPARIQSGDEGTNYYVCSSCNSPCDLILESRSDGGE